MEKINYAISSYSLIMLLVIALPFVITGCFGENKIVCANKDDNITVVKKYFRAIDNRDTNAMNDLFAIDAIQDFVGNDPIIGVKAIVTKLELVLSQLTSIKTEFVNFIANGDTVFAHVKHVAVFKAGGAFLNRTGINPPLMVLKEPVKVSWQVMATFQLKDGRIVEEIIVRDELAILQQIGTLTLK
ncbi:MAG: nuclear transport factor 2 family protein [Proteobacteria bacterium]|nr:nuclear transport factor 2 family protein [Pseudomonadota bacterium]